MDIDIRGSNCHPYMDLHGSHMTVRKILDEGDEDEKEMGSWGEIRLIL